MVNLANLNFKRHIMHQIFSKEDGQPHASVELAKEVITIDNDAKEILRQRLINAAGKNSKAFELEIGNSSPKTFFDIAKDLKGKDDQIFIQKSQQIAFRLAEAQTSSNMQGGYLLVIEALEQMNNTFVLIVVKAELHEAFRSEQKEGITVLKVLKDIFLSPSQKLYKIGIIYEKLNPVSNAPNDSYGCFLFDDQFRRNTKPAEYFYMNFLGFDIGNNSKIQSKLFYDQTHNFIKQNISDPKQKVSLINELRNIFTISQETTITPLEFSTSYFSDLAIRDLYAREVLVNFTASIVKNSTLIDYELNHKKINFPNKIKVIGPDSDFDNAVILIDTPELFITLDPQSSNYTILKIAGQPFINE